MSYIVGMFSAKSSWGEKMRSRLCEVLLRYTEGLASIL